MTDCVPTSVTKKNFKNWTLAGELPPPPEIPVKEAERGRYEIFKDIKLLKLK